MQVQYPPHLSLPYNAYLNPSPSVECLIDRVRVCELLQTCSTDLLRNMLLEKAKGQIAVLRPSVVTKVRNGMELFRLLIIFC